MEKNKNNTKKTFAQIVATLDHGQLANAFYRKRGSFVLVLHDMMKMQGCITESQVDDKIQELFDLHMKCKTIMFFFVKRTKDVNEFNNVQAVLREHYPDEQKYVEAEEQLTKLVARFKELVLKGGVDLHSYSETPPPPMIQVHEKIVELNSTICACIMNRSIVQKCVEEYGRLSKSSVHS